MKTKTVFSPTLQSKYVNAELWSKILKLNLKLIIDRLVFKHDWSKEKVAKAILEYRQFLYLTQVVEYSLSPTKDVDEVWHEHILHTNKYAIDCQRLFGKFLHHFPTPASWLKKVNVCDVGIGCKFCTHEEEDENNLCTDDLKRTMKTGVCDGGGGPDSQCSTCNNNPRPEPKCSAHCEKNMSLERHQTKSQKAFCGVDGDGPQEEPKPTPKPGSGGDCRASGTSTGGDCTSQQKAKLCGVGEEEERCRPEDEERCRCDSQKTKTVDYDSPKKGGRKDSFNFADIQLQFFVLN